ncbi:MAG: hypothetical protein GY835_20680 [bacterium]|nr:hypothetical protein [bacterium]
MNKARRNLVEIGLLALCFALTFFIYHRAFGVFFATDDLLFLMRADGLEEWLDKYPLRRLLSVKWFFTAAWNLFGDRAELYHLVILSVHALSSWLTVLLARRLRIGENGSRLAGLFFLLAPVGFTCLHWISGVQDVLLALFALLTALCLTRRGLIWELAALICYVLAMLSKEAGFLLLPVLVLVLPQPDGRSPVENKARAYRLLGVGVPVGFVILYGAGAFMERQIGDPYATKMGFNVVQNLLTYTAWLVRPWDFFPDQKPEFNPALWRWGLVLPLIWVMVFWRRPAWRQVLLKTVLVFLALLVPVLPLVRHSYLYYLYVPLIPVYLLAAAGLARIPGRGGRLIFLAPLLLLLLNVWQGTMRHEAKLDGKLIADPILRYAELGKVAVNDLREMESPLKGNAIFLVPFMGQKVDLAKGLRAAPNARRAWFVPVWKALRDGTALALFFPELKAATLIIDFNEMAENENRWRESKLYWIGGAGHINWLGRGVEGRHALSRLFYQYRDYERVRRELEVLRAEFPADVDLLCDICIVADKLGDRQAIGSTLDRMREMNAESPRPKLSRAILEMETRFNMAPAPE